MRIKSDARSHAQVSVLIKRECQVTAADHEASYIKEEIIQRNNKGFHEKDDIILCVSVLIALYCCRSTSSWDAHRRAQAQCFSPGVATEMVDRTDEFLNLFRSKLRERGESPHSVQSVVDRFTKSPIDADPEGETLLSTSRSIAQSLASTRAYISKNRPKYLNFISGDVYGAMTESERDEIDRAVNSFIESLVQQLDRLKEAAMAEKVRASSYDSREVSSDERRLFAAHMLGVVTILSDRLIQVSNDAEGLRAVRIRHSVKKRDPDAEVMVPPISKQMVREWIPEEPSLMREELPPISPEFAQILEEENEALAMELVETRDQVRQAEKSITEIAKLSQFFAAKVLEQATEIENLYEEAVQTTFIVRRGNREVEQMAQGGNKWLYIIALMVFLMALSLLAVDMIIP